MNLISKIERGFTVIIIACIPFLACTQNRHSHPKCDDVAFDNTLDKLLQFSVPTISCAELYKNRHSYYIFDTREWNEYSVSHIPSARFAGYSSFDIESLASIPKNTPIVVYCSVGYRSEKIGEKLMAAGYSNVKNLYGSIFEWVNEGYPLEDNAKSTVLKVHAYNTDWGRWIRKKGVQKVY